MKRISRFQPPVAVGRDRAERHYADVHHPFARRLFREHGDLLTRYVANRADRQHSLRGRFEEEPTAWRFVITEVDDDVPDASAWLPAWAQPLIWDDHRKCIASIEAWEVDETVVVDQRCGQVSMVKQLFLYAAADTSGGGVERYLAEHVPALAELFAQAFGARLYLSNVVRRQAATSDDFGAGAAYTGGYAPQASMMAVAETYFDAAEWAEEFYSSAAVVRLLQRSPWARVEGYSVTETVGVDKRLPPG